MKAQFGSIYSLAKQRPKIPGEHLAAPGFGDHSMQRKRPHRIKSRLKSIRNGVSHQARESGGLGGECEAAAGAAKDQLLGHFLLRQIDKILAAAVHRHYVFDIEFVQFGHDLAQIVIRSRRQVKAANEGIDLVDAADLLGPFQRVDDAGMSA